MRWRDLGVCLAVATHPLSVEELSAGERETFERLRGARRRRDWLLGRTALKRLLGGADTSAASFPHTCLSLSHGDGMAVAVAGGGGTGLGVDFERRRPTDPRTARFFLHQEERVDDDLLRLWTVKEALFKATSANAGAQLLDYRLQDPASLAGTATDVRGNRFRYVCDELPAGPLAVAVCLGRPDVPV